MDFETLEKAMREHGYTSTRNTTGLSFYKLAKELGVHESTFTRARENGFAEITKNMLSYFFAYKYLTKNLSKDAIKVINEKYNISEKK